MSSPAPEHPIGHHGLFRREAARLWETEILPRLALQPDHLLDEVGW